MLILYCGMKYDYGRPAQGYSFEHHNFYDTLVNMGHDVLYFDFMTLSQGHGKSWMNRRLLEVARTEKPDLLFSVLFDNEIYTSTIGAISKGGDTVTINWFCDDHWRFENYSKRWAPYFNWVVTTAQGAVHKYDEMGYRTCIKSQWACNHFLYRKLDLPLEYDVTFVGQLHGTRRAVIEYLRQAGIDIRAWGNGWQLGRITQEEMIHVFNQSRINLNLSNASVASTGFLARAKGSISTTASRALRSMPGGSFARRVGKSLLSAGSARLVVRDNCADAVPVIDQIKGRNFEVPGCGGFLLTGRADNLEEYYRKGEEVACFDSTADLVEQIRFYLTNEERRNAVALAGYRRTLEEHTYMHRFSEIFKTMGLAAPTAEVLLAEPGLPGVTREIT